VKYAAAGLGVAVLLIVAMVTIGRSANGPDFVDHLTIVDGTAYTVDVDVAGARGDGWVGVGTVGAGRTARFEEVVDQGPTWLIRFSYADVDGGEVRVTRAQLERDGWRVTVPADVATRLAAAGLAPARTGAPPPDR
jgi:hypothetical protein